MEFCNDELLALSPRDGRGMPAREAFPEERYTELQAVMDDCFHSGTIRKMSHPLGVLIVAPRTDARDRVCGVATYFAAVPRPLPVPPLRSLPELPVPVGPLSEEAG